MFHDVLRRRDGDGPVAFAGQKPLRVEFLIWDVYDDAAAQKKFRRHSKKKFRVEIEIFA
jgi:hypothetical protein